MAAHRYWRLFSVYNNGYAYTNVCELEMFTSLGGTNVCTGGAAFASSEYPGWEATKAFDGVKTGDQGWSSLSSGSPANQWVGYDFGAGNDVEIEQVAITARTNATGLGGLPRFFAIEWSDDGITWSQKGYIPPQTSWGANETRTFNIVNELSAEMSAVSLASRSFAHRVNRPPSFKKSTTGGDGSLGGTVLESSAPVQGAIITVFDETTHAVAGQATTNIIGEWVVDNINPNKTYFAVAKHPDDLWEMKISSRRKPSRVNPTIKPAVLLGEHSSAILTTVGEIDDPYFANVVSLVPCSGLDGSTTFTDILGNTWTTGGGAVISDDETYFGENTLYLNGTNAYVRCDNIADLLVGANTYTIEFHAKVLGEGCLFAFNTSAGGTNMLLFTHYYYQNSTWLYEFGNTQLNKWAHYAFVNDSGLHKTFINGVLVGSASNAATPAATDTFCIGQEFDSATPTDFLPAYISNIRISNVARYTENFTPPPVAFATS